MGHSPLKTYGSTAQGLCGAALKSAILPNATPKTYTLQMYIAFRTFFHAEVL